MNELIRMAFEDTADPLWMAPGTRRFAQEYSGPVGAAQDVPYGGWPVQADALDYSGMAPGIGDVTGPMADARMYLRDPEQLTPGNALMSLAGLLPMVPSMTVFHGSPHKWLPEAGFPQGRPRMDKIGTGEGAQVYGHGVYFAETPDVAKQYANNVKDEAGIARVNEELALLSKIMAKDEAGGYRQFKSNVGRDAARQYDELLDQRSAILRRPGSQYSLDLPDEQLPDMLDWDAPLSYQQKQMNALAGIFGEPIPNTIGYVRDPQGFTRDIGSRSGSEIMRDLYEKHGPEQAAEILRQAGIPGVRYFDQMSRGAGDGTRNFVVWDQDLLNKMPILGVE